MNLIPLVVPPEPAHRYQHGGDHVAHGCKQGVDHAVLAQDRFFFHVFPLGEPKSLALSSNERRGHAGKRAVVVTDLNGNPVTNPGVAHLFRSTTNTPRRALIREDRCKRGMARIQPGLSPCSAHRRARGAYTLNPGVWVWRKTARVAGGLVMSAETASLGALLARHALSTNYLFRIRSHSHDTRISKLNATHETRHRNPRMSVSSSQASSFFSRAASLLSVPKI